jgi:hypothetical protein
MRKATIISWLCLTAALSPIEVLAAEAFLKPAKEVIEALVGDKIESLTCVESSRASVLKCTYLPDFSRFGSKAIIFNKIPEVIFIARTDGMWVRYRGHCRQHCTSF